MTYFPKIVTLIIPLQNLHFSGSYLEKKCFSCITDFALCKIYVLVCNITVYCPSNFIDILYLYFGPKMPSFGHKKCLMEKSFTLDLRKCLYSLFLASVLKKRKIQDIDVGCIQIITALLLYGLF